MNKKIPLLTLALIIPLNITAQAKEADITVSISAQKRAIAQNISLQYHKMSNQLVNTMNQYDMDIPADELLHSSNVNTKVLTSNYMAIRSSKGLNQPKENAPSLVQLRLADSSMLNALQQGQDPLFAFAPDGNESQWSAIEAYDTNGKLHLLDVYTMPKRPVVVVELNNKAVLKEGLEIMRSALTTLATNQSKGSKRSRSQTDNSNVISATVLSTIQLKDDEEPWISGAAEVYAIVTGVNPSRDEPILDIIDMPYLDHEATTYHPNQILIHWQRYRWQAADVILMEHDDATNYKALASKLLDAAAEIMRINENSANYAIIAELTNGILQAMPDAWFTNDDDYVDVFYTLQEGETYQDHIGAGNNATATFTPLIIQPRGQFSTQ